MTAATFYYVPTAPRERRVGTARIDHWFKRAPQAKAVALQAPAEISTARIDHWFQDQARAGQWLAQGADRTAARAKHEAQSQQAAAKLSSGVRAWWQTLRQRMALAQAEADLRALAIHDPRVLRDLEVARDLAEWKSHA